MNTRALVRPVCFVAACATLASLSGCFAFVWIPGPVLDAGADWITGARGDHCVPAGVQIGDSLRMPSGSLGRVSFLAGQSVRCLNPMYPTRAQLEALPS